MIKANPTRWFPALLVAMVACLALGPIGCDRHSGHGGHGHGTHGDHKGHDHDEHDDRGGHDHAKHGEAKHGEDARTIRLSESQRKEFGVETDKATLGVLGQTVQLPGEVVINPDSRVHVVPRVSGVVRDVHKRVGDRTQANDPLLVLDSAELAEAKSDYLGKLQALELEQVDLDRTRTIHDNTLKMLELVKGQPGLDELVKLEKLDLGTNRKELLSVYADFITAKAEHGRQRTLFEDRVASQASFDAAQSRYQAALATYLATRDDMRFQNRRALDVRQRRFRTTRSQLDAAKRKLFTFGLTPGDIDSLPDQPEEQLSRLTVRAPIAATVIDRHAARGELLKADSDAFLLADLSSVWVYLTVYQKDLNHIRAGLPVELAFGHGVPDARGVIDFVSPIIDEHTRTARARVVLSNPDGYWRPGLFMTGRVKTREDGQSIVVPRDAVQVTEDGPVIFIKTAEGFRAQPVKLGRAAEGRIEIIDGMEPNQLFAAANTNVLKAELNRAALEHAGHSH